MAMIDFHGYSGVVRMILNVLVILVPSRVQVLSGCYACSVHDQKQNDLSTFETVHDGNVYRALRVHVSVG